MSKSNRILLFYFLMLASAVCLQAWIHSRKYKVTQHYRMPVGPQRYSSG